MASKSQAVSNESTESSCVLLSGGHGGLIRCSVVPKHVFKPNRLPGPLGRVNKQRAIATAAARAARAASVENNASFVGKPGEG